MSHVSHWSICSKAYLGSQKRNPSKVCITDTLWRESTGYQRIPITKGVVIRKVILCHNIIMITIHDIRILHPRISIECGLRLYIPPRKFPLVFHAHELISICHWIVCDSHSLWATYWFLLSAWDIKFDIKNWWMGWCSWDYDTNYTRYKLSPQLNASIKHLNFHYNKCLAIYQKLLYSHSIFTLCDTAESCCNVQKYPQEKN